MNTKIQFEDDSISLSIENNKRYFSRNKAMRRSLMPNFGSSIQKPKPTLRTICKSCPSIDITRSRTKLATVFSKCNVKQSKNPMKSLKRKLSCSIQNVKYATRRTQVTKIVNMKDMKSEMVFFDEKTKSSEETKKRILSAKEEEIEDVIIWEETFLQKKKRSRVSFLRK